MSDPRAGMRGAAPSATARSGARAQPPPVPSPPCRPASSLVPRKVGVARGRVTPGPGGAWRLVRAWRRPRAAMPAPARPSHRRRGRCRRHGGAHGASARKRARATDPEDPDPGADWRASDTRRRSHTRRGAAGYVFLRNGAVRMAGQFAPHRGCGGRDGAPLLAGPAHGRRRTMPIHRRGRERDVHCIRTPIAWQRRRQRSCRRRLRRKLPPAAALGGFPVGLAERVPFRPIAPRRRGEI